MTATVDHVPTTGRNWPLKEALSCWGGISRPTVLRAEKARLLKLVRFGRRCFVPDAEVRRIAAHGLPSLNAWAGAGR